MAIANNPMNKSNTTLLLVHLQNPSKLNQAKLNSFGVCLNGDLKTALKIIFSITASRLQAQQQETTISVIWSSASFQIPLSLLKVTCGIEQQSGDNDAIAHCDGFGTMDVELVH